MAADPNEALGLYSMIWRIHDEMAAQSEIVQTLGLEGELEDLRQTLSGARSYVGPGSDPEELKSAVHHLIHPTARLYGLVVQELPEEQRPGNQT
jgi:hypothetical protein